MLSMGDFIPHALSGDGSVVLGNEHDASEAGMIWDPVNGSRIFRDVLVSEYGLEEILSGWSNNIEPAAISPDGLKIVGWGSTRALPELFWLI